MTPADSPLHHAAHGPPPCAGEEFSVVDPERALVVTYASKASRPALSALFALDERMGAIVAKATEPTIGLIRLAWWREALERLDHARPPAEPLLMAIGEEILNRGMSGAMLSGIEDGWAALLDGLPDADAIARHGRARGSSLFAAIATLLGADDPRVARAGAGWALADLGHRHSDETVKREALRQARVALVYTSGAWPRALGALAALAALARWDARTNVRRQGSPARIARLLALRLFGR